MDKKHVLGVIFSLNLTGEGATFKSVAAALRMSSTEAQNQLKKLERSKLLSLSRGKAELTPEGRDAIKVVFIGGGFELIHFGHIHTISKAKELGDVLVVSVARDSTIRKRKGRDPLIGEKDRVRLLSSLRQVDAAILGVEGDIYVTLEKVGPDVVALGYDQYHLEQDIKKEAVRRGLQIDVVRLDSPYPDIKTSSLLKEL